MSKISEATRQELVTAIADRYRSASRKERRRILDEFVAVTKFHRKHAIRVLTSETMRPAHKPRARSPLYDEAVTQAFTVLWEASDRICGKRLKAIVPILVPALERHGHLRLDERVRKLVFSASAATIDRLLSRPRAATLQTQTSGATTTAVR